MRKHKSLAERFWPKVSKTYNCWLWTGTITSRGQGQLRSLRADGSWTNGLASRIAYELQVGLIPPGYCVLHSCDDARCVNPAHLHLGSIADNNRECRERGRHAFGERNGRAVLTAMDLSRIRLLWSEGATQLELSDEFGVSRTQIGRIVREEAWRFLLPQEPRSA